MLTENALAGDLRQLGLRAKDRVLVHSSMKALGWVEGGPAAVLAALRAVVGPDGILVFPSFQKGGEHQLLRSGVLFDVRHTPTEQGLLPETFRRCPGVVRSLSPTHCLAAGGRGAEALLAGHERCRVSVGHATPFERLADAGGKILLLGVTHACNTMLHYVENISGAPTLCREVFTGTIVDYDGRAHKVPTHPHMPGLARRYERVEPELRAAGIQTDGRVGEATARCIDVRAMVDAIGARVRRDPLYLIDVFCPSE